MSGARWSLAEQLCAELDACRGTEAHRSQKPLDVSGVVESALLEALDIAIAARHWARVAELAGALKSRHEGGPAAAAWARLATLARAFGAASIPGASDSGAA